MNTHGRGSIVALEKKPRKRCRKWQLRVRVGKHPITKKYMVRTKVFHGPYSEAEKELDRFKVELGGKALAIGGGARLALREYIEKFKQHREYTQEVKERTILKDHWNLKSIAAVIGEERQLRDISEDDIETAFAKMRNGDTPTGNKCSGTYLSSVYGSLNAFYKYAVKNNDIESNPMRSIIRPRDDTKQKRALTKREIDALLSKLDASDRMEFGIILVVCCGLRRSECTSSVWDSIQDGTLEIMESKTKSGLRRIPLPNQAMKAIETRKRTLLEELEKHELNFSADMPLLSNGLGEGITAHHFGVWWQQNRDRFGINLTLHELRHSYASLLAETGASPKDMQELIGHSKPMTSIGIYTHTNLEHKREVVERAFGAA